MKIIHNLNRTDMTTMYVFEPLWIIIQVFLLWLLADFITGIVHWWEDAYGNPQWPILGKYIIQPNMQHHKSPRNLLQGSYWDHINTSLFGGIIFIATVWFCGWHSWQMIACVIFCMQANEIHAITHRTDKENGAIVVWLQKIGIIQKRKTHGWHHKAPYDTNFCIMTEFLNPVLNKIGLWEKVEWFIAKVFRIKILRGSPLRGGL